MNVFSNLSTLTDQLLQLSFDAFISLNFCFFLKLSIILWAFVEIVLFGSVEELVLLIITILPSLDHLFTIVDIRFATAFLAFQRCAQLAFSVLHLLF